MNFIDLFSGIGGASLGLEKAGMTCLAHVEIDPFCRAVLEKHWPKVPHFADIKDVNKEVLDATGVRGIDLVYGSPPCQAVSVAGKRKGANDERFLWNHYTRIVNEIRPRFLLAENVPGLRTIGSDQIISEMEQCGYTIWPVVVGAWAVGAPHQRNRVWIIGRRNDLANPNSGTDGDRTTYGGLPDERWGISTDRTSSLQSEREISGNRLEQTNSLNRTERELDNSEHQRLLGCYGRDASLQGSNGQENGLSLLSSTDSMGDSNLQYSQRGSKSQQPICSSRGTWDKSSRTSSTSREPMADCESSRWDSQTQPEMDAKESRRESGYRPNNKSYDWPAKPGESQYEWECPRVETTSQTITRLGGPTNGISSRLVLFARRNALKAYGNAVIPQIVEHIGRIIIILDTEGIEGLKTRIPSSTGGILDMLGTEE